jgi:hypothetical protein
MNKVLTTLNWFGLFILFSINFICYFGRDIFGKTIAYGLGLGDMAFVLMTSVLFVVFIILINHKKIKSNKKLQILVTLSIYFTIIYFSYSFTYGRGAEYKWNGELFYPSEEGLKRIKEMQEYDSEYNK